MIKIETCYECPYFKLYMFPKMRAGCSESLDEESGWGIYFGDNWNKEIPNWCPLENDKE